MKSQERLNRFDGWLKLPLLPDYIMRWAAITPENDCIVFADNSRVISYAQFDQITDRYAMQLKNMGLEKGDIVVTQFLATPEFFFLIYGCLKAGLVISPLDIKQQPAEVVRDVAKIKAKAFFCYGMTPIRDFTAVAEAIREECPYVRYLVQSIPDGKADAFVQGAIDFSTLFSDSALDALAQDTALADRLADDYEALASTDPALIIFTTGTTGSPKPALMSHQSIMANNEIFSRGVGLYGSDYRFLNIMPTSHVAGTAQGPMTAWYRGGAIITLSLFHPAKSLEAVARFKATMFGGVPTMFRMIWALPDYDSYNLSSLRYALYGGSAVDTAFLTQLAKMAPTFGTALGMTETSGYFTCTPRGIGVEEMAGQVGQFYPELAQVTIRDPMNEDGSAGKEITSGEPGEICVEGDVIFLGYVNDPVATARTISKEGILYTGDMGILKKMGTYEALIFSGRRKFVIKPKGYLVFPDEVADFLTSHPKISQAQVVGVPHDLYEDGVFAFVQAHSGESLTAQEVMDHCRGMASYKRPLHVELWPAGKPFPLNKTGKVDTLALIETAETCVKELRQAGRWDKNA